MPRHKRDSWGFRRKPSALAVLTKSYFSGSSINYRTRCTSGEGRLCDIFQDLPLWNEYFWQAGHELREQSPGELSLVEMYGAYVSLEMPERKREAATLLYHLLTLHRCVVAVEMNGYIFRDHHRLICDALRKSPSLRRLKLSLLTVTEHAAQCFAAALPFMKQLRCLVISQVHFDDVFVEGLSEFLANTLSLTTFSMSHTHIESQHTRAILRGLERNLTITSLALNTLIMHPDTSPSGAIFSEYLRENRALRTLTVMSRYLNDHAKLRQILGALSSNDTLTELNLIHFSLDSEHIRLITTLLTKNRTLKSFNLIDCIWNESPLQGSNASMLLTENFGKVSSRIHPWLVALTENKTLAELTLDLSCFDSDECRSFIKTLASSTTLKQVTVTQLRSEDVAEICRAMREAGMRQRFFLGSHQTIKDPTVMLTECKEMTCIRFDSTGLDELEPLRTTLSLLPSCSHVMSLCLKVSLDLLTSEVSSLIAQYITSTTVLRELTLCFFDTGAGDIIDGAERALVKALSANNSICRLCVRGLCFDEEEIQMLAETVQSSRMIYDLSFYPDNYESAILLLSKLSQSIRSNYTLLYFLMSQRRELGQDWFTIVDVKRRNLALVTRAAYFVMGTRRKYCAEAAELVHFNPGLVEKVRELGAVDDNEAVSRIRKSLKSFSELDDFMRVAGVVKYSVTCHKRNDGRKQLVDIGRDCWLCIRQYLKVGDILDAQ
uniref:Nlr family card domain protein n=1 Tax=Rhipicephalus zambeziensis TaxID=60191 RepID=A0A224YWP3_9ACAR